MPANVPTVQATINIPAKITCILSDIRNLRGPLRFNSQRAHTSFDGFIACAVVFPRVPICFKVVLFLTYSRLTQTSPEHAASVFGLTRCAFWQARTDHGMIGMVECLAVATYLPCNVEIYSIRARMRPRTIDAIASADNVLPGYINSRLYVSPHTGISLSPCARTSLFPSIAS
jgi:hypothetical protein